MELVGLPDFHAPVVDDAPDGWGSAYWPFGGGARCFLIPNLVALASLEHGSPDFRLELIRPLTPGSPPTPHGVLELSIAVGCSGAERALAALRQQNSNASLEPLAPAGGCFQFIAASGDVPATLLEPVALAHNGLGALRFVRELPIDTALFMRDAVAQGTAFLRGLAELDYIGVAPRLPVRARFDPVRLLEALGAARSRRAVV